MAAKKSAPVDTDLSRATPVEPGDPVEAPALTQMGGTFAERQAARKAAAKSVKSDAAEDKSVSSASTKSAKKK